MDAADRTDQRAPDAWVAFLLTQVGALAGMRFAERLSSVGLKPPHAGLLRTVAATPGLSQRAAADTLGLLPSQLVVMVDELSSLGLLERRAHAQDRRQRSLFLTARGEETLGQLGAVAVAHGGAFLTPLTDDERGELGRLLQALVEFHDLRPGIHPGYRNVGRPG